METGYEIKGRPHTICLDKKRLIKHLSSFEAKSN